MEQRRSVPFTVISPAVACFKADIRKDGRRQAEGELLFHPKSHRIRVQHRTVTSIVAASHRLVRRFWDEHLREGASGAVRGIAAKHFGEERPGNRYGAHISNIVVGQTQPSTPSNGMWTHPSF